MSSNVINITAGLDIGNGWTKGLLRIDDPDAEKPRTDEIDIPSLAAMMLRPNLVPVAGEEAVATISSPGFYDDLDLSFNSALVADSNRRLLGTRALSSDGVVEEFDLHSAKSKAENQLSAVLVLGLLAAGVLREHVLANKSLPDTQLVGNVTVSLALPVDEYLRYRTAYAAAFTRSVHEVFFHGFEVPISVRLHIVSVPVLAEGASGVYAIQVMGQQFAAAMLADCVRHGFDATDITASDIMAATNIMSLDIGSGTINMPVMSPNSSGRPKFNTDLSRSRPRGYGHVLDAALVDMADARVPHGFTDRAALADYLIKPPSVIKRRFYDRVRHHVAVEEELFAKEVTAEFGRMLEFAGATMEVAFVYGGGSGPIRDVLYPLLLEKVAELHGADAFPVLYLDAAYSRKLNREGLFIAADQDVKNRANVDNIEVAA